MSVYPLLQLLGLSQDCLRVQERVSVSLGLAGAHGRWGGGEETHLSFSACAEQSQFGARRVKNIPR